MKKLIKIILLLSCNTIVLFAIGQQFDTKKFNPKDLAEVFIDKKAPNYIMGKLSGGAIVKILSVSDLPKKMDGYGSLKGFPLKASSFICVSSSRDKTKIGFVVRLSEVFHADSGSWLGVLDLKKNKIIQIGTLDKDYLRRIILSPSGKYLLEEYDYWFYPFEKPYIPFVITNTEKRESIFHLDGKLFTQKEIKELRLDNLAEGNRDKGIPYEYVEARFVQWADNEKSIIFELIKVEESYKIGLKKPPKRIKERRLGVWSINLDGTNFRRIKR